MITGETLLYGLVAHPAHHSLSPLIHNMGFDQQAINARYVVFDSQSQPAAVSQAINTLGIAGINLSMPYKQTMRPFVDMLSPSAQLSGAINTIKNDNGRLIGINTDGDGFWRALQQASPMQNRAQTVILGAGGAALAVIEAAASYGVQTLTVFKRANQTYPQVAKRLAKIATTRHITINLYPFDDEVALQQTLATTDCLINATNLGMQATPGFPIAPRLIAQIPSACLCADLIYAPRETAFLKTARLTNHPTLNGLGMLVEQAALSFEFWTGKTLVTAPIYAALTEENKQ